MRRKPSVWRLRYSNSAIGLRRSPLFHPAAAPSKSAPMAKGSTPNSSPANGRTSTRSLARSRKSALKRHQSGKQESRKGIQGREKHRRFKSSSCFPAFLIPFSWRVKGAWWPSRSSKSPSVLTDRGRFDSYPLRPSIGNPQSAISNPERRWSACRASKSVN
jgi:hypothetical protein